MAALNVHPVADLFPMLADDELKELAEDISERGLLQPIVLDSEGRVLDGRNRLAACGIAGVEPTFTTYDGDDPDGYALAVNIARRHLTTGARAIIAARAARLNGYGAQKKIATETGISNLRISDAAVVLDWCDTGMQNSVLAGDMPLSKAVEEARRLKKEDADRAAKKARLGDCAPDLLARVGEGLSLDDAIAALDARKEKARAEEHARSVEERRDIDAARRTAETIVTQFRTLAVTVLTGSRLGEPDLITKAMVYDLRATVDLLEGEL